MKALCHNGFIVFLYRNPAQQISEGRETICHIITFVHTVGRTWTRANTATARTKKSRPGLSQNLDGTRKKNSAESKYIIPLSAKKSKEERDHGQQRKI